MASLDMLRQAINKVAQELWDCEDYNNPIWQVISCGLICHSFAAVHSNELMVIKTKNKDLTDLEDLLNLFLFKGEDTILLRTYRQKIDFSQTFRLNKYLLSCSFYSIDFKNLNNSLSVEIMMDVCSSKVFSKVSIDFKKVYKFFDMVDWL